MQREGILKGKRYVCPEEKPEYQRRDFKGIMRKF